MVSTPAPLSGSRETIGIVGCGRMGSALAGVFSRCGFPVHLASRRLDVAENLAAGLLAARAGAPEWVAASSGILILATPSTASCGELAARLRPFVGSRPVIDISNPGMDNGYRPYHPAATRIASALGSRHVVKALNCVAAKWLHQFPMPARVITVPVAADDANAKAAVARVLRQAGFDVIDAGPLRNSSWIEELAQILAHAQRSAPLSKSAVMS